MGIAFRTGSEEVTVNEPQDQEIANLEVDWLEWVCGAIEGTVTDVDNNPVAGVLVKAVDTENPENVFYAITNEEGFYAICVPTGTYDVFVLDCDENCFEDLDENNNNSTMV